MRVGRELLPGIFLAYVLHWTEQIDRRIHAMGSEEHLRRNGFSVRGSWRKSILLPPIALVTNVNGYSSLLDLLVRVLAAKCLQMSRNVYKCIRMSRQFQFFGTLFCVLPNRSSPSLMETEATFCGHFTAFQLTAFTCKFFLGESSGFSVRAPQMSTKRTRQEYFFDSGSLSRPCPYAMQLSWVRSI